MFPFVHVCICEFNKTNKPNETRIYTVTAWKKAKLCKALCVCLCLSIKNDWILPSVLLTHFPMRELCRFVFVIVCSYVPSGHRANKESKLIYQGVSNEFSPKSTQRHLLQCWRMTQLAMRSA